MCGRGSRRTESPVPSVSGRSRRTPGAVRWSRSWPVLVRDLVGDQRVGGEALFGHVCVDTDEALEAVYGQDGVERVQVGSLDVACVGVAFRCRLRDASAGLFSVAWQACGHAQESAESAVD